MAAARSDTCNFVKMFETWLRTVFRLIISSWEIVALPAHGRGRRDPDPSTDAGPVSTLADDVLPLIRTRTELYRWSAAKAHGAQMHAAVDILKASIPTTDPVEIYSVTHKALASAIKVIARADDSSGIIGDACRRLLDLHPKAAAAAASRRASWWSGCCSSSAATSTTSNSTPSPTCPPSANPGWVTCILALRHA